MFGHWIEFGDGHTYPNGGQKEKKTLGATLN
jgi:hypothetical protein